MDKSLGSPLEDIERNIGTLRERSRDLYMGSPISTGALRTLVTNVVGSGLRLNASIDAEFLKLTKEEADAMVRDLEKNGALK